MPSKFVAKAFVRDEVQREVGKLRNEMLDTLEEAVSKLRSEPTAKLREMNAAVQSLEKSLDKHNHKIGMLIEGGIRRLDSLEKGEEWVKSVTIDSAESLVDYVIDMLQDPKRPRAYWIDSIKDLLREPVRSFSYFNPSTNLPRA